METLVQKNKTRSGIPIHRSIGWVRASRKLNNLDIICIWAEPVRRWARGLRAATVWRQIAQWIGIRHLCMQYMEN